MRSHSLLIVSPLRRTLKFETAVEIINEKSTRISNKRDGVVYQVVIDTLSEDNNTIGNEYLRMDRKAR